MAINPAAPRLLIQQLRRIMADSAGGQDRLDRIVGAIASLMVAEVCSIYIQRQDGSLELFATEGLKQAAVHTTFMKRGEGLVGLIALQEKPVNLPEAQAHPAFSYRPETGEEIFHSFLGVPIRRGGKFIGVLTIQNERPRTYSRDDEEALLTTAMVLGEHFASGSVTGVFESINRRDNTVLRGQALTDGIALGHVVLHLPRIAVTEFLSHDQEAERKRLEAALDKLRQTVDAMLSRRDVAFAGEHRDVLDAYRMFANDRSWERRLHEAVAGGLTAEAATERVRNDMRVRLLRNQDAYWRERFKDFEDLSDRLQRVLSGRDQASGEAEAMPVDAILVARSLGPAELLDYDRSRLRGLVIEEGGTASHVAIVARALGIPAIGQTSGVIEMVESGDAAVIDADAGELHVRPSAEVIEAYSDQVRFRARRQKKYGELRDRPAVTKDGVPIELNINAGLLVDLPQLDASGAAGIGLFRTELEFMISSEFPLRDRQARIYSQVIDNCADRRVVFRMLDIGGDKMLPYFRHAREFNPALGWRAVRMALDRPGLFRTQAQALLRAAGERPLHILIPMVSEAGEYEKAREAVLHERDWLAGRGHKVPSRMAIGAMVEVPAVLWQLERLSAAADFLAIGSNDLLQFLFAADRANARVATRYDVLSSVFLRVLRQTVAAAARHNTPLTLCGEMAGRPLEAMALVGLGLRSVSMAPASIGPIKAMIHSLDAGRLQRYLHTLLDENIVNEAASLREALRRFAIENGVVI